MTSAVRSICPFCSMGCSLLIDSSTNTPYVGEAGTPTLDYDVEGPFNRGSLCGKGNMALELCTGPRRLESPRLKTGAGRPGAVGWEQAMESIAERLEAVRAESGPRAIGLYLGPHLTDQEVRRAIDLAAALGTPNLDGGAPEDQVFLGGIERSEARPTPVTTVEELEAMTAMLCVGDVFSLAPCVSKAVLNARYDRRRNLLGTLSGSRNRTTWFGRPDLRCQPGHEIAALALMLRITLEDGDGPIRPWSPTALEVLSSLPRAELEELAGLTAHDVADLVHALAEEEHTGVLAGAIFGDTERSDLAAGLAALLADATGSRFLALTQGPNALGLRRALAAAGYPDAGGLTGPEMFEAAVTGDLRALCTFGFDPLAAMPGSLARTAIDRLDFYVMTAAVPGECTDDADVLLAAQVFGEKPGSVTNAFGATLELGVAMRPPGEARSELEIIDDLLGRLRPAEHPPTATPREQEAGGASAFFAELDLFFRLERRGAHDHEVGRRLLLPRASVSHGGDGALSRHLSWPRHENPAPEVVISERHARSVGVTDGDEVLLRSAFAEARVVARIEPRVPDDLVFASSHEPAVRHLMRWRLDPALRNLDLRPGRVSIERATRNGDE